MLCQGVPPARRGRGPSIVEEMAKQSVRGAQSLLPKLGALAGRVYVVLARIGKMRNQVGSQISLQLFVLIISFWRSYKFRCNIFDGLINLDEMHFLCKVVLFVMVFY